MLYLKASVVLDIISWVAEFYFLVKGLLSLELCFS